MSNTSIRVVVVDDHPLIRRGVRLTFGDQPDIELIGEGACKDDAVELAERLSPDIVLLDLSMPGGGFEAAEIIARKHPGTKIAIMTVNEDLPTVQRMLQAGVAGYISKGADSDDLVGCVQRLARGERYISPSLAVRLLHSVPDAATSSPTTHPRANLTQREQELLALLGEGLSNAEIAARTGLAETTVKQYVSGLIQKLGVRNRTAAALLARAPA